MDYPRYDPASRLSPLSAAELDALDQLLQRLPADGVMPLDGADGYLTALAIGPPALLAGPDSAGWLPLAWGGDDGSAGAAPFASRRQRKSTVVLLLRHLHHLSRQFAEAPQDWEPIFSIAGQGEDERADARDWCTGFLQAVDLDPGAWGVDWSQPALAPLLLLGGGIDGVTPGTLPPAGETLDDPGTCDRYSRAIPDAVLLLRQQLRAPGGGR